MQEWTLFQPSTCNRNRTQHTGLISIPPPAPPHIDKLTEAFEALKGKTMAQTRDSADCPVRTALDEAVAPVIGMKTDALHELRRRIAAEPTVCGPLPATSARAGN